MTSNGFDSHITRVTNFNIFDKLGTLSVINFSENTRALELELLEGNCYCYWLYQRHRESYRFNLARNYFNVALNDLPLEKAKLDEVLNEVVSTTGVQCQMYFADVSNEKENRTVPTPAVPDFGGIVCVGRHKVPIRNGRAHSPDIANPHGITVNAYAPSCQKARDSHNALDIPSGQSKTVEITYKTVQHLDELIMLSTDLK
ncbi:hypothetical protein DFS33DRAFT_1275351 [Desarmillaria ectypa]|nr:hypothetical protein DFS33DRAFT_1275351 [Desarmillaria ectypa]